MTRIKLIKKYKKCIVLSLCLIMIMSVGIIISKLSSNKNDIEVIQINDEQMNKQYQLLLENLFDYEDSKYLFLICDNIEHNEFSLQKWYESYGFKVITNKFKCPLMVLEKDN